MNNYWIPYLHTQPLKVKPFINQWGVLRQKFIIKNMLKMNRMIVNWNAVFRRQYSVYNFQFNEQEMMIA